MGGRHHVILGAAAVLSVTAGALVWSGVPDPGRLDLDGGVRTSPGTDSGTLSAPANHPSDTFDSRPTADRRSLQVDPQEWTLRLRAFRGPKERFDGAHLRVVVHPGCEAKGEPLHTTFLTTDGDGEATWSLPTPDQTVTVQVQSADTEVAARKVSRVIPVGEVAPLLEVHLYPLDHVVLGVVTNQEDKPVPGARVSWAQRVAPVHSDQLGRFRLRMSSAYGSPRYYVVAPGYSCFREDLSLHGPGTTHVTVRLKPGFRVFGRVTDTDGQPLEGVEVSTFWGQLTGQRTHTDADGNFQLDTLDIDRGQHYVVARREDYVRTVGRVESTGVEGTGVEGRIDLTMKRAAIVTGTVFGPDGRPAAGATVGFSWSKPVAGRPGTVVTHKDGRFKLPHQTRGKMSLWTHKRGFAIHRQRLDPPTEGSAVELQVHLQPGHFVAGRVTDRQGQAVAGARVTVVLDGGRPWLGNETTDADGRYRLEDLPAGLQEQGLLLYVSAPGYLQKEHAPVLDRENIDIVLQRSLVLRGRVVDGRTGSPLQDFRINIRNSSKGGVGVPWPGRGRRFQDPDGYWEVPVRQIKPGTSFDVEAVAKGYAPMLLQQVTASPDLAWAGVLFRMFPGVALEGLVLERGTGRPVAGAKITLLRPGQQKIRRSGAPSQCSTTDGSFRFEHVAPGSLVLHIEHRAQPFLHGPLVVPSAGNMDRVTVLVGRAGRIEGVLEDPESGEVARVRVILSPGPTARRLLWLQPKTTRTDAAGRFQFDALLNTDYVLTAITREADGTTAVFRSEVNVQPDMASKVVLTLEGHCTLKGTVRFLGLLGSSVSVRARPMSEPGHGGRRFHTRVKDGRFGWRGLPAGSYVLEVRYRLDGKWLVHEGAGQVVVQPGTDNRVAVQVPPR